MPRKGKTVERGYGAEHRALRAKLAPEVAKGLTPCWRCGGLISSWQEWDLGHDDGDRTLYRGPEHRGRCNRRNGAIKGNRARGRRRRLAKLIQPGFTGYTDPDW
jgi:hypothetical protein